MKQKTQKSGKKEEKKNTSYFCPEYAAEGFDGVKIQVKLESTDIGIFEVDEDGRIGEYMGWCPPPSIFDFSGVHCKHLGSVPHFFYCAECGSEYKFKNGKFVKKRRK
jgi:hypothetical protein